MANDTVLTICQQALLRAGFTPPTTFAASVTPMGQQTFALLKQVDNDLKTEQEEQQFRKQFHFVTVDAEEQLDVSDVADFPDGDFQGWANGTMYNRSMALPVYGPLTAAEWQLRKAEITGQIYNWWTLRDNKVLFYPNPAADQDIYFEYFSDNSWLATGGTPSKATPTADTDYPILDSELYILGVKYLWLQAKGLPYGEQEQDYLRSVDRFFSRTEPAPVLYAGGNRLFLFGPQVPQGNWGQ